MRKIKMYKIKMSVIIPLEINNVDAKSMFEAAEKTKSLIQDGLPLAISFDWEKLKDQIIIDVKDIEEEGEKNEFEN